MKTRTKQRLSKFFVIFITVAFILSYAAYLLPVPGSNMTNNIPDQEVATSSLTRTVAQ